MNRISSLGCLVVIVVVVLFMLSRSTSTETSVEHATSVTTETYFVPASAAVVADHAAAIEALTARYYQALREKRFEDAADCYAPNSFVGTGLEPAEALKMISEVDGDIPNALTLYNIRVEGRLAIAELVIVDPNYHSPAMMIAKDAEGNSLGVWAKTLYYELTMDGWRLASKPNGMSGGKDEKILRALEETMQDEKVQSLMKRAKEHLEAEKE